MKCPTCGGNCILPAEKVLDEIYGMYMACSSCPPDPKFNKNKPFREKIDENTGRCTKCTKRHLDLVIGHVLTILKENGIFPEDAALKEVGTPLIAFGFQVPYPPRLDRKNLVLIMDSVTKDVADKIMADVPEIKGVVKRTGPQSRSVGILDTDRKPHTYELLSGCDMRCDVVSSSFGEICVYKNQSRIHIEFTNTKIKKIEERYLKGELNNAVVVDGFCGPGTLGLLCVLAGAKKVILNDAWLPAVENAVLNVITNSEILGVKIEFQKQDYEKNKLIGDEPVLIAKACGATEIMVYHGDIRKLGGAVKDGSICLIDTFPSVNPFDFMPACRDIAKKVIVV